MKGIVLDGAGLLIHEADTVATALEDLSTGREIEADDRTLRLADDIPFGHTFALEPITDGETVLKYGEVIGRASEDIESGEWVHTHNCESTRGRGDAANETGEAGREDTETANADAASADPGVER